MSITINLTPELEVRLQEKATQQGRDISLVISELLARVLDNGNCRYRGSY